MPEAWPKLRPHPTAAELRTPQSPNMTSPPVNDPRRPSFTASPRTGLLPSPFSHSDEAIGDAPGSSRFGPDPPLYPGDEDIEPQDGSLLPPRSFQPFFTMIKDVESGETYHPSIYYVFADDEPDPLSTAALNALDAYTPHALREAEAKALIDGVPREEERYIMVNMGPTGTNVVGARSLAPNWAVTSAQVRAAPTFDGGEAEESDGLMLMIEGLGSGSSSTVPAAKTAKERRMQAEGAFEDARKKTNGNMTTAMEHLAHEMVNGIHMLDKVAILEQ